MSETKEQGTTQLPWSPFRLAPGAVPGAGRRWRIYAAAWLVYLLSPLGAAVDRGGWQGAVGVVLVLAFGLLYASGVPRGFRNRRTGPVVAVALFALALAMLPF